MNKQRKRHPFGQAWRAEMGNAPQSVSEAEYRRVRAEMEAARRARYAKAEAARLAKA